MCDPLSTHVHTAPRRSNSHWHTDKRLVDAAPIVATIGGVTMSHMIPNKWLRWLNSAASSFDLNYRFYSTLDLQISSQHQTRPQSIGRSTRRRGSAEMRKTEKGVAVLLSFMPAVVV